jgi:hypothetical protein
MAKARSATQLAQETSGGKVQTTRQAITSGPHVKISPHFANISTQIQINQKIFLFIDSSTWHDYEKLVPKRRPEKWTDSAF